MPLSSRPIVTIKHVQQNLDPVWTIDHNQNGYPLVDVYTTDHGIVQKILPMRVEYVDENTVKIHFSQGRKGFATVVV